MISWLRRSRRRYSAADDKPPEVAQALAERSPDPALFAVLGVAVLVAAAWLGQQVVTLLSGPGLGAFSRDTCALAARRLPSASSYDVVLPAPGVVLAATKSGKSLVIDGYSAPQPGL